MKLITNNGDQILIYFGEEVGSDSQDEITEEIRDEMQLGGLWWATNWDIEANFKGNYLDHINMKNIIGIID